MAENDELRCKNQALQNSLQFVENEIEICNSMHLWATKKNIKLQNFTKLLLETLQKCKNMNCRAIRYFNRSAGYFKKIKRSINKIVVIIDKIPIFIKYYKRKIFCCGTHGLSICFAKKTDSRILSVIMRKYVDIIKILSKKCKFHIKYLTSSTKNVRLPLMQLKHCSRQASHLFLQV